MQKNVNDILENDIFIIAESDKNKFDCSGWANKFNPLPDSVFNNAECVDSNDGKMKRLIGNHKNDDGNEKSGLAPGIIAAIVIVVVVVVAAAIILVYFFVIRRRRAQSASEDNIEDNDQINL